MAKKSAAPKPAKKTAPKPAAAKKMTTAPAAKATTTPAQTTSWFDAKAHKPLIGSYAQRLKPFIAALADGAIGDAELAAQEERLIATMKKVEPALNAKLHASVTELLCELTAYDVMQMLHKMHTAKPQASFQG